MMGLIKFRVKPEISFLMEDEEFKRRIIRAYESQVEANHGWAFTVKYKGYRVRFDIDGEASSRAIIVYKGYVLEAPQGRQLSLLEVC
jgi:hypothetical protein